MPSACYVSDLHLEFNGVGRMNLKWAPADILILAGDTIPAESFNPIYTDSNSRSAMKGWRYLEERVFPNYKEILYLMGNHDYYHSVFAETYDKIFEATCHIPNFYILENNKFFFEGALFLGCTLWTDFRNGNPYDMNRCQIAMNDYNYIYKEKVPFKTPIGAQDTYDLHKFSRDFLESTLRENRHRKTFVLTHHAPTFKSIGRRHQGSDCTGAYASDLSELILDNPQIQAWVHGHTHDSCRYQVGDTWVVSNQCGYKQDYYDYKQFEPTALLEW